MTLTFFSESMGFEEEMIDEEVDEKVEEGVDEEVDEEVEVGIDEDPILIFRKKSINILKNNGGK